MYYLLKRPTKNYYAIYDAKRSGSSFWELDIDFLIRNYLTEEKLPNLMSLESCLQGNRAQVLAKFSSLKELNLDTIKATHPEIFL